MASATADSFLKTLEKSELLSRKQLAEAHRLAQANGDAKALAKALIKRDLVTRWQAKQLLAGGCHFFLGRYRLLEKLGEGGMGSVYKAAHIQTGRVVALKVMSRSLIKQEGYVERFLREVRLVAALNHPNIVTAYDADQAEGLYFLVMEYVPGRDLRDWLKKYGRLPIDWSCEIIMQAALGLQHAHERGLVHRDIKPGNLLVVPGKTGEPPTVKLMDLGLARIYSGERADQSEITQSGQVLGTPDYMAPEQARSTRTVDIRADLFALGCTLFRMITGELPFSGGNAFEKLMARTTETARSVREVLPDVPMRLERVIAKMLEPEPEDRYQTPADVARALAPFALSTKDHWDEDSKIDMPAVAAAEDDLEGDLDRGLQNFLSHLGGQSAQETAVTADTTLTSGAYRARKRADQQTQMWIAVSVGVSLTLLLSWLVLWSTAEPPKQSSEPQDDRPSLEDMAKQTEWKAQGNPPSRNDRNPTLFVRRMAGHNGMVTGIVFLPGGQEALTAAMDGTLFRWNLATGEQAAVLVEEGPRILSLALNPNGRVAAAGCSDGSVRLWHVDSGKSAGVLKGHQRQVISVAFSPDGSRLVSGSADRTVRLWHPWDKQELDTFEGHQGQVTQVAFAQEGTSIVSLGGDETLRLWDVETRSQIYAIAPSSKPLISLAVSPRGRYARCGIHQDSRIVVVDLKNAEPVGFHNLHGGEVRGLSYSPDGHYGISASADMTLVLWKISSDEVLHRYRGHRAAVTAVAWDSGGRYILSGSENGVLRLWRIPTDVQVHAQNRLSVLEELRGHGQSKVHDVAFSTSGKWLASVGEDGAMRYWRLGDPQRQGAWDPGDGPLFAVAMRPEADEIAAGGKSGTLRVWKAGSDRAALSIDLKQGTIHDLAYTTSGSLLAAATEGGTLALVDAESGKEVWKRQRDVPLTAVAFDAKDARVAAATKTGRIWIFDPVTGETLTALNGPHEDSINSVHFQPNGSLLASGGSDGRVAMWDLSSERLRKVFEPRRGPITGVAFTADGKYLLASTQGILAWEVSTGRMFDLSTDKAARWSLAIAGGNQFAVGQSGSIFVHRFAPPE